MFTERCLSEHWHKSDHSPSSIWNKNNSLRTRRESSFDRQSRKISPNPTKFGLYSVQQSLYLLYPLRRPSRCVVGLRYWCLRVDIINITKTASLDQISQWCKSKNCWYCSSFSSLSSVVVIVIGKMIKKYGFIYFVYPNKWTPVSPWCLLH